MIPRVGGRGGYKCPRFQEILWPQRWLTNITRLFPWEKFSCSLRIMVNIFYWGKNSQYIKLTIWKLTFPWLLNAFTMLRTVNLCQNIPKYSHHPQMKPLTHYKQSPWELFNLCLHGISMYPTNSIIEKQHGNYFP